jgi:hypothetical protein
MDNLSMESYQDRQMRINRPFFYYKLNCFLPGITLTKVNVKVDFYLGFYHLQQIKKC